jgi:translation initiation factor IF-3
VNERIFAKTVRLIDADGQQVGVMSSRDALRIATDTSIS